RSDVAGRRRQRHLNLPQRVLEAELACLLISDRPVLPVETPAPEHDVHAESGGPPDHLLTDAADAQQAERQTVESTGLRVLLLVPLPGAQLRHVVGDAPVERENQREGQLRDGNRVLPRTVRHVDAALRRARDVDGVVSRAGPHDQREASRIEHRARDLRAPNDQHVRARLPYRFGQCIVFEVGFVGDGATGRLQPFEAALLELVSNENSHWLQLRSCGREARREAWARTTWTWAA